MPPTHLVPPGVQLKMWWIVRCLHFAAEPEEDAVVVAAEVLPLCKMSRTRMVLQLVQQIEPGNIGGSTTSATSSSAKPSPSTVTVEAGSGAISAIGAQAGAGAALAVREGAVAAVEGAVDEFRQLMRNLPWGWVMRGKLKKMYEDWVIHQLTHCIHHSKLKTPLHKLQTSCSWNHTSQDGLAWTMSAGSLFDGKMAMALSGTLKSLLKHVETASKLAGVEMGVEEPAQLGAGVGDPDGVTGLASVDLG
ncbi:hypothetical protein BDN71DRAFT_1426712 [Pleurotus eryngii]|uniref:Uncharacterized protein n=1 Tax=Pleurotus eryngii TaxID=5323 RepID=A0A9P6ABH5_PLEER|nr:hypothetical protein BDN71DRAFT_1426712 [Pleurotus eryngii]